MNTTIYEIKNISDILLSDDFYNNDKYFLHLNKESKLSCLYKRSKIMNDNTYDKCATNILNMDSKHNIINLISKIAFFNSENKNINLNDCVVEFYFEKINEHKDFFITKNNTFPLISSITYLNDCENECLNIFTDIDFNTYKYKKYRKQITGRKLVTTNIKKDRHIVYNGGNANIFVNNTNVRRDESSCMVLFINIWDTVNIFNEKTKFTNEFDINISTNEVDINFIEEKKHQIELNNDLNTKFYEDVLYKKNNDCFNFLFMILNERIYKNIEFTDVYDIKNEELKKLKNKYGDVINDIKDINNSYMKQNRFYQRFIRTNMISDDICKWIINETETYVEKNGWKNDHFKQYPTYDLQLSKLNGVHDYFLKYELTKIMKYIEQSYCLPDEVRFHISDLNIIKYSDNLQLNLESHVDSGFLTFNIALNGKNEYEGGGTYFDDGITVNIDKGDMLVHCGKVIHSGLTLTKGTRYILVGFINIRYEA